MNGSKLVFNRWNSENEHAILSSFSTIKVTLARNRRQVVALGCKRARDKHKGQVWGGSRRAGMSGRKEAPTVLWTRGLAIVFERVFGHCQERTHMREPSPQKQRLEIAAVPNRLSRE